MSTFLSMLVSLNQLRPPLKILFQACQWVNWIFWISLFWLANKKLLSDNLIAIGKIPDPDPVWFVIMEISFIDGPIGHSPLTLQQVALKPIPN
jgi:hypothetical protein